MRNRLTLLWTGIVLLLLVLALNGYVTLHSFHRLTRDNSMVQHTQQLLFEAEHLENLLVDAETGQRGYLYTGEERYLDSYERAIREVDGQMAVLASLAGNDPEQQASVHRVAELAQAKLEELAATVQLARAGHAEEAKAIVLTDRGKNLMDDIRRAIAEIENEEVRLQNARVKESTANTRLATSAFVFATGVAAAVLLSFGGLLDREMRHSKAAADAILEQKEWLRTTLHSIGDAVIATDTSGHITLINAVAASLTEYSQDEAPGKSLTEVFSIFDEATEKACENPVAKVLRTGIVVGLANHTVLRRRDGSEIAIDDSAAPIRNAKGEMSGVVLVFRDVTEQRKVGDALRNADKLASAGRFAATIAHEINNPLEAVMNSLFLLNTDPGLSMEGRRYLLMAEEELSRVAAVARQTLAFYKDTSSPVTVNVAQLLDEVITLYGRRVESRRITIVRDYCDHAQLLGSPGELRQVFANLILNSIDALAPEGQLSLRIRNLDGAGPALRVEVEDDGIGIPEENLRKIFEPFFTTKKDVGTGLGLWAAKTLVEKHNGELRATSSNGKTKFTVLLPVAQGQALAS
jgi:PAS domain S-box-containing protein